MEKEKKERGFIPPSRAALSLSKAFVGDAKIVLTSAALSTSAPS